MKSDWQPTTMPGVMRVFMCSSNEMPVLLATLCESAGGRVGRLQRKCNPRFQRGPWAVNFRFEFLAQAEQVAGFDWACSKPGVSNEAAPESEVRNLSGDL